MKKTMKRTYYRFMINVNKSALFCIKGLDSFLHAWDKKHEKWMKVAKKMQGK